MSILDIDSINKSNFQCFQLKDKSIYFGEIQYLTASDHLISPQQDPEAKSKGKPVRHGFGIQLFGTNQDNFHSKYEGYWERDQMTGQCRIFYPDGAFFEGRVKCGVKEGFGKFIWKNGDQYEGNWKNGRFEGGGTFQHHEGNILKGLFKNNYFVKQGDIFINPFFSQEEIEEFLKRRNEINQLREKNQKQKLFFFEQTDDFQVLADLIKKSNSNNRIPLIMSSKQCNKKMKEVMDQVSNVTNKKWSDFDLRRIDNEKKNDKHKDYLKQIKNSLSDTLALGQIFVINIDESDCAYDEIFYPDLREYYNSNCFPSQIWNLDELKKNQVYEKVVGDTKNLLKFISNDFRICVWTKYKLDQQTEAKRIIEKIERRLSGILPIIKLDFIMVTQKPQESVPETEQQQEEQ